MKTILQFLADHRASCEACGGEADVALAEVMILEAHRIALEHAEMLAALQRVRSAFYVDGSFKALRAAFCGTKELVAKVKESA